MENNQTSKYEQWFKSWVDLSLLMPKFTYSLPHLAKISTDFYGTGVDISYEPVKVDAVAVEKGKYNAYASVVDWSKYTTIKKSIGETKQMASYGYGVAVEPRTQKAKSLFALKKAGFNTPSFQFYRIEQFLDNPIDLSAKIKRVEPTMLLNRFVRPCPIRPRHGFVDSRPVLSLQDAERLIAETVSAEPEAELISMPFIDAEFSGIWTPGKMIIGPKNDGATAGKDSRAIPVFGIPFRNREYGLDYNKSEWRKACQNAGVTEAPYVELLWKRQCDETEVQPHGTTLFERYFVQLRNGPALPNTVDFIPEETVVKQIVVADGDLLEWESKVKEFTKGTVVHHPGGSLASHYAVHAVLNNIPVLISRQPKLGEKLQVTAEQPKVDVKKIRSGFIIGATAKMDYLTAVYVMLAGCHSTALWLGKHDELLGLAMGCAYRLTVCASLGEFRHAPGRTRKAPRNFVYSRVWNKVLHNTSRVRFLRAIKSFNTDTRWPSNFGGPKWGALATLAVHMYNAVLQKDSQKALEMFNQCVHSVHNGGWAFNKFVYQSVMDEAAINPLSVVLDSAPTLYCAIIINEKIEKYEAEHNLPC